MNYTKTSLLGSQSLSLIEPQSEELWAVYFGERRNTVKKGLKDLKQTSLEYKGEPLSVASMVTLISGVVS